MEFPRKERLYSYAKSKTERLRNHRRRVELTLALLTVILPLSVPLNILESGTAVELLAIAFVGGMSLRAIANVHIDLLAILKRDLDRDEAENLIGFETPD